MKFALVSHVLPPSRSGQAMVLYRILKDVCPEDYCLISQQNYATDTLQASYSERLPARYYRQSSFQSTRAGRFGSHRDSRGESLHVVGIMHKCLRRLGVVGEHPDELRFRLAKWRELVNALFAIPSVAVRSRQIADIVTRERCEAIVGCSGDLVNLPSAYLASRLVGIRFYAYLFDYYSYHWLESVARCLAQRIEPRALSGAAAIIVPSEFLQEELRRRYEVEATVIHNPCEVSAYCSADNDRPGRDDGEMKIVFTGAIYRAHYSAFHNLLAAMEMLEQPNVKLHLYTAQSPRDLAERGIQGPIVFHEHQPLSAMPAIQQQADLLFLPLAFTSPYPELVRTSAPGKMGEYLAAGRPILVHAPPDSFVTWYFRRHACGLVVDQNDPGELARVIKGALTDTSLQQQISARAQERAHSDFSIWTAQARFADLMELNLAQDS